MALAPFVHVFAIEQLFSAHSRFFFDRPSFINIALASIIVVAFIYSLKRHRSIRRLFTREFIAYIALLFYILVTGLWSYSDQVINQLIIAAPYIIASVLLVFTILNTEDLDGFIKGLVLFGSVTVLALVLTPAFGVGGVRVPWIKDIYGNNYLLNYLQLGYSSGLLLICVAVQQLRENKWVDFLLRSVLAILALYVMVRSGARGQTILSIGCAIGAYWVSSRRGPAGLALLVLLSAATVTMFVELLGDMWGSSNRWDFEKISEDGKGRLEIAYVGLEMWANSVVSMVFGIGHFAIGHVTGSYPHIVPLEVLAEEGLIGISIYLFILTSIFKKSIKLVAKHATTHAERTNRITIVAIMLLAFFLSLKQGTVLGNWPFFMFGLLVSGLFRFSARGAIMFKLEKQRSLPIAGNKRSIKRQQ